MYRNKIWAGRELLKVTFLNPYVLHTWGITRDDILDWAKVWDVGNEKVPTFICSKTKGDIRVKLSGSWCTSVVSSVQLCLLFKGKLGSVYQRNIFPPLYV